MSPTEALPTMIGPRIDAAPSPPIPVLISVPALRRIAPALIGSGAAARVFAERRPVTSGGDCGGRSGSRRTRRWPSSASDWPGDCRPRHGVDRTPALAITWTWPRWRLAPRSRRPSPTDPGAAPVSDPSAQRSCSRSSRSGRPPNPTPRPRWSFPATCCPTTITRSRPMREVDEALSRAYPGGHLELSLERPSDASLGAEESRPSRGLSR